MSKPIYISMCILNISKVHVCDFHYKVMKQHFKSPNILDMVYLDTDGIGYYLKSARNLSDVLKQPSLSQHLDLSTFPNDEVRREDNKAVIGTFKENAKWRFMNE